MRQLGTIPLRLIVIRRGYTPGRLYKGRGPHHKGAYGDRWTHYRAIDE